MTSNKNELLSKIKKEILKEHVAFDSGNRISKKYLAPIGAVDGSPCLVIEYIYYPTSTTVKGRSEGYGQWSASFDGP